MGIGLVTAVIVPHLSEKGYMQVLVKKLGDANKAESKPIAQGLVNTRSSGCEPYLAVNILSGQLPPIPTTAACSRARGHNIKIFEEERSDFSFDLFCHQLQPYTGRK